MGDELDQLLATIEHLRSAEPAPPCVSDETLEALATRSLAGGDAETAMRHVGDCWPCLQRYARLRNLLDAAAVDSLHAIPVLDAAALDSVRGAAAPRSSLARAARAARRVARQPLPTGWAVVAAAALVLATWIITTERSRRDGARGPVELSDRADAARVTGVVEAIRDASVGDRSAYTLRLRDAKGTRYAVRVWGPPTVAVGDRVRMKGTFFPSGDAEGGYEGVATTVEKDRS